MYSPLCSVALVLLTNVLPLLVRSLTQHHRVIAASTPAVGAANSTTPKLQSGIARFVHNVTLFCFCFIPRGVYMRTAVSYVEEVRLLHLLSLGSKKVYPWQLINNDRFTPSFSPRSLVRSCRLRVFHSRRVLFFCTYHAYRIRAVSKRHALCWAFTGSYWLEVEGSKLSARRCR